MSVALPVMSDLHLGQMAASKLDLKTSEYHPEHQSNEKSFDCKVQSVLPALSADEVSVCALEDVGGGTHFFEAHLSNSAKDWSHKNHVKYSKGRVLGILEEFVVVLSNSNLL